jgi:DNA-binding response OmpR family regulator
MTKNTYILIIGENDTLYQSFRSALDPENFEIHIVKDHTAATEAVSKHMPHLILVDEMENTEQVVSKLKLDSSTKDVPVFIFTSSDEGEKLASEMWADSHILIPFNESNIGDIINLKLETYESMIKERQHHKKTSVLVIDDEDDVRRIVELNLRTDGFDVYTAADGPSGIKAIHKYKPQLILLDVMMPGMDGLEVLMNIKWNKKLKKIPVIMLTAKSTLGDMDQCYNRRADGYITKPFNGKTLGSTIKKKLKELKV